MDRFWDAWDKSTIVSGAVALGLLGGVGVAVVLGLGAAAVLAVGTRFGRLTLLPAVMPALAAVGLAPLYALAAKEELLNSDEKTVESETENDGRNE